ncbi:MAG: hypothetical protein H7X95_12615 [Deltaproteobacteria bacterium]|nr:hypothetical protein [Deltaproteobacteria bacterium]
MLNQRTNSSSVQVILLAVLTGVAGGCATTPPTPAPQAAKARAASDFYPLDAGWKWAYDLERQGEHMLAVYAVLERTPESAIVQAGEERIEYAVTGQGVAQKEGVSTGDFVLKNPIVLGAEWNVFAGKAKITSVTTRVSGPSGDYTDCIVVETLRSDPTRMSRTTYAPGVGPVAIEVQVQAQGRFVTTLRASLRGATRPGQDPLAIAE